MIFDTYDREILKLCGLCRYFPYGLSRHFDAPFLRQGEINHLQEQGLIKMLSDGRSYKLTGNGRDILADMGYIFPGDAKTSTRKRGYKRKLINARWNVLLSLAGMNVYSMHASELSTKKSGYISSLVMRTDNNVRVLAGTRFFGLLKIQDTLYVPYHIESENDWLIPGHEKEIFLSQAENIGRIKNIRIILLGKSLEDIWNFMHPSQPSISLPCGQHRYSESLEILGFHTVWVPLTKGGALQMRLLLLEEYRKRIVSAMGCDTKNIPKALPDCDGMRNGVPHLVAIDCDSKRLVRSLKQIALYDKSIEPRICCLSFQKQTIFRILEEGNCQKSVVVTLDKVSLQKIFPELLTGDLKREPILNKEGGYLEVKPRRNTKPTSKTW